MAPSLCTNDFHIIMFFILVYTNYLLHINDFFVVINVIIIFMPRFFFFVRKKNLTFITFSYTAVTYDRGLRPFVCILRTELTVSTCWRIWSQDSEDQSSAHVEQLWFRTVWGKKLQPGPKVIKYKRMNEGTKLKGKNIVCIFFSHGAPQSSN